MILFYQKLVQVQLNVLLIVILLSYQISLEVGWYVTNSR